MSTGARADSQAAASKSAADKHNKEIVAAISMLCLQWDLRLEAPNPERLQSPRERQEKKGSIEAFCVHKIVFLQYKNGLTPATNKFQRLAEIKWKGWVNKPKAERGLLPKVSRTMKHPTTADERTELLKLLAEILKEASEKFPSTPSFHRQTEGLNDAPISSDFLPKSNRKRSSDDRFPDVQASSKKQRHPPVTEPQQQEATSMTTSMAPPIPRYLRQDILHHETSFISDTSSVFTAPLRNFDSNVTQSTIPDDDEDEYEPTQPNSEPSSSMVGHPKSSNYGHNSSFDELLAVSFNGKGDLIDANGDSPHSHLHLEISDDEMTDEEISQELSINALQFVASTPAASELYDRLKNVFPKFNSKLEGLPMPVLYEITRVCLHNSVSMEKFQFTQPRAPLTYDTFWALLQKNPLLHGKPFPPKCQKDVWSAAMSDFKQGDWAVVMAGNLSYSIDSTKPFYQFRLEPMRFDKSYRLCRRHGIDRFFELDFPSMSSKKAPVVLQKLGCKGQELLVSWLVDGFHNLFSRQWKPFHLKPKERRERKMENDEEYDTSHRVFFFAVDGHDFKAVVNPLQQNPRARAKMSIKQLLNATRPIAENTSEKYLKLFARTDLVVSKNTPTVVLLRSQMIYMKDITELDGEVMTDGAGQISFKLASAITAIMGLTTIPSGFQGRIGEAKGFWSVDYCDRSEEIWIKICDSQRKWKKSRNQKEADHESNRTFEVLRYSTPLKAAQLNLQFMPLLQDRAINPSHMETILKELLEEGLQRQLLELQVAMKDPQALRQWLKGSSGGDRLKFGCVQYRAGLPTSIEEKLNMFLDAGFDATKLKHLKDEARTVFRMKCDDLQKRLNITVSKSTYVYMVPDFSGVLEPDEVYLDFSSFMDESSGLSNSNFLHNGTELLVARSPAHYVSDIQKVKIAHKVELMGLKDVIVFSTKGNPSLAAKLSGGDYDGDIAWVCWEPKIVDNFQNANVPEVPDLVKEGFIKKSSVSYRDLVKDCPRTATSTFLNQSFMFNLQQNLLGIATSHKESLCYAMGNVNSREAVYMSTLLSALVDQAKQGYTFTPDDWTRFKTIAINKNVITPGYKDKKHGIQPRSKHIIDRLMLAASGTVGKLLTEFEQHTQGVSTWDNDLVVWFEWLRNLAKGAGKGSEWHAVFENLNTDVRELTSEWTNSMSANEDYLTKCDRIFERFILILPRPNSVISQCLLPSCVDEEYSQWALIRASTLFASFAKRNGKGMPSPYVWNVAGRQLARIKSQVRESGFAHSVTPKMYAMLKPDAGFVKKIMAQRDSRIVLVDEASSVVNADEIADLED